MLISELDREFRIVPEFLDFMYHPTFKCGIILIRITQEVRGGGAGCESAMEN